MTYKDNKELKEWMWQSFKYNTHTKYYKYFEEWWENALESQLEYFDKQMYRFKNNVLGILDKINNKKKKS